MNDWVRVLQTESIHLIMEFFSENGLWRRATQRLQICVQELIKIGDFLQVSNVYKVPYNINERGSMNGVLSTNPLDQAKILTLYSSCGIPSLSFSINR